jgi:NADH-quinone oxidoreductase subunit E
MTSGNGKKHTRAHLRERKAIEIEAIMKKYPIRRSGVMDVMYLVQDEDGWISPEMMTEIAEVCSMQPSEVMEMASFYTMYHREPVGKNVFWVCGTLPCALCGADGLFDYLKEKLGADVDEVTEDGLFTVKRIECLGACSEAPLMLVNDRMATKLTRAKVDEIIEKCKKGKSLEGIR